MSVDQGIIGMLIKLKEKFSSKDVHPQALDQIALWESRILEFSHLDDFTNMQTTKAITQQIHRRYKDLILQKAFTKGLTTEQVKGLEDKLEILEWLLKLFRPQYQSEIEEIKKAIEYELEV